MAKAKFKRAEKYAAATRAKSDAAITRGKAAEEGVKKSTSHSTRSWGLNKAYKAADTSRQLASRARLALKPANVGREMKITEQKSGKGLAFKAKKGTLKTAGGNEPLTAAQKSKSAVSKAAIAKGFRESPYSPANARKTASDVAKTEMLKKAAGTGKATGGARSFLVDRAKNSKEAIPIHARQAKPLGTKFGNYKGGAKSAGPTAADKQGGNPGARSGGYKAALNPTSKKFQERTANAAGASATAGLSASRVQSLASRATRASKTGTKYAELKSQKHSAGAGYKAGAGARVASAPPKSTNTAQAPGHNKVGDHAKYGAVMKGKKGGTYVMHNGKKYYGKY